MRASVIICTFNRALTLQNTLKSLEQLNMPGEWPWELLIIDNNSNDRTKQIVEVFSSNTKLILRYFFEKNQGLSNARNSGIENSKGDIIAFSDDDMEFDPYWLLHLISTFERFNCLCVAGKIIPKWQCDKPPWLIEVGPYRTRDFHGRFDLGSQTKEIKTSPFGGNMAFKRDVFNSYGLFRTDLGKSGTNFMCNEEIELCQRLLLDGKSIIYSPKAIVYHLINKEQTQKRYYLKRNFSHGKSSARMKSFFDNSVFYFGVPRHLYRKAFINLIRWLFTFESHVRFYHKQNLYHVLGRIVEHYNRSRKQIQQ